MVFVTKSRSIFYKYYLTVNWTSWSRFNSEWAFTDRWLTSARLMCLKAVVGHRLLWVFHHTPSSRCFGDTLFFVVVQLLYDCWKVLRSETPRTLHITADSNAAMVYFTERKVWILCWSMKEIIRKRSQELSGSIEYRRVRSMWSRIS